MNSRRGSNAYKTKSQVNKGNLVLLDQARRYRLVHSAGSIKLICPKEGDKKEAPVDLSYLLTFPQLTEPFAQAVQKVCESKASALGLYVPYLPLYSRIDLRHKFAVVGAAPGSVFARPKWSRWPSSRAVTTRVTRPGGGCLEASTPCRHAKRGTR